MIPLFSNENVEQYLDKRDVKIDKRRRVKSYAIRSEETINKIRTQKKRKNVSCVVLVVILMNCSIIMSQTIEDQGKMLFKNKLCCGCYG